MLNLYQNEVVDMAVVEQLKSLASEASKTSPFLSVNWHIAHTTMGKAIVKLQILGIESQYLLPDAISAFRRLAGKEIK